MHAQHERGGRGGTRSTLWEEGAVHIGCPVAAQADAAYNAAKEGDLKALKRALHPSNDVAAQVGYNRRVGGPSLRACGLDKGSQVLTCEGVGGQR